MPEINPPDNLPIEPKPTMAPPAPAEAPVQEFFKREEIKTMERDVAELREEEAKAEKERIASLKAEIKIQAPTPPPAPPTPPTQPISTMPRPIPMPPAPSFPRPIPPSPPTPSIPKPMPASPAPPLLRQNPAPQDKGRPTPSRSYKKIIVRGLIIILSLSVLGFGFWLWQGKKQPEPQKQQPVETETPTSTTTQEAPPLEETTQTPAIQERLVTWGFRNTTATRTIDTIIVHSTYNTLEGDLYDIEKVIGIHQDYKTANHYLISRDGAIYRLVPDEAIAYQAGTGIMPDGRRKNIINNFSLGVELIYTKTESPNEAQYQSLAKLVNYLRQQYTIPSENILANNQINTGRKDDPWNFDWAHFNQLIGITKNIQGKEVTAPPISIPTPPSTPTPTPSLLVQKCTDGTLYAQCSTNIPKYCDNGNLIDKCSTCGCSLNRYCDESSNLCKIKLIFKGGLINPTYMNGARGVYVSGDYAYVTGLDSSSLAVVDVSNPSSPRIVGGVIDSTYMDYASAVYVFGNYAYVTGIYSDSLSIVDISNHSSPTVVGGVINSTYMDGAHSVYVSGNYAYIAGADSDSLAIVDVSNPMSPRVVGGLIDPTSMEYAHSVYVFGKYAYVAGSGSDSLAIVDVSNPMSPRVVGRVADSVRLNLPKAVYVSGNYAYVSGGAGSVTVIDVSNPTSPLITGYIEDPILGVYPFMGGAYSIHVVGKYAYVSGTDTNALIVVDISNPMSPKIAGSLVNLTYMKGAYLLYVSGKYAYVAGRWSDSLAIIDISGE